MKKCNKCNLINNDRTDSCLECKNNDFINIKPAGFFIRLLAIIIDYIVLSPLIILSIFNLFYFKNMILMIIVFIINIIIYRTFMHYKFGSTAGKMILGLKIVNQRGDKITLSQSFIREIFFITAGLIDTFILILLYTNNDFLKSHNYNEILNISMNISPVLNIIANVFGLFIALDCIITAFTSGKKAIHDFMAKTYCVYKEKNL